MGHRCLAESARLPARLAIGDFRSRPRGDYLIWLRWAVPLAGLLGACAPLNGYSDNPADDSAVRASLKPWFSPDKEERYYTLSGPSRRAFRDAIVINRLRAYEIEFGSFTRRLWADGNLVTAGGDLLVLALSGLGATTGHAATGAALAAASAGIVGAQASINKDLYYQRTLPALLAQMEANRNRMKGAILQGLAKDDDQYPLYRAQMDLESLQRASGIPGAVSEITQSAAADSARTQQELVRPTIMAALDPVDVAARRAKLRIYLRGLATSQKAEDEATLHAIGAQLGVSPASTLLEEAFNLQSKIYRTVKTPKAMDALSRQLFSITNQEF